jgi:5S rRNA maturation endonuclease (ribonuclease M5)
MAGEERIMQVLQSLGCENIKHRGSAELMASCPVAAWTHSDGDDKHPSFSINYDKDENPFFCFACGFRGNGVKSLVRRYVQISGQAVGNDLKEFTRKVDKLFEVDRIPEFLHEINFKKPEQISGVNFEEVFKEYEGKLPRYALDRGLGKTICKYFNLGFAKQGGFEGDVPRLVFPIYDIEGKLVGLSGRKVREDNELPKYYFWKGFRKSGYLYGENKIAEWSSQLKKCNLLICEGFFDVVSLFQNGFLSLGLMGSKASNEQVEKIIKLLPQDGMVYLMLDADKAGKEGKDHLSRILKEKKVPGFICMNYADPKELKREEIFDIINNRSINI